MRELNLTALEQLTSNTVTCLVLISPKIDFRLERTYKSQPMPHPFDLPLNIKDGYQEMCLNRDQYL